MKNSLELLGLAEVNLSLGISVLIYIGIVIDSILKLLGISVIKRNNIFAKSLLGTTMQDNSIRKRSVMIIFIFISYFNLIYF